MLLDPPWLINPKYFPNITEDPPDYGDTNIAWVHISDDNTRADAGGFTSDPHVLTELDTEFRIQLQSLTNVAIDRGAWSTNYEKGTLTTIARKIDILETDLRSFADGEKPRKGREEFPGLKGALHDLNLDPGGGYKGTAAGAFGNRLAELTSRLRDFYEQLNGIDKHLSTIMDEIQPELNELETQVYEWVGDPTTYTYHIIYEWYSNTTSVVQDSKGENGEFAIVYNPNGDSGIITHEDTKNGIQKELNRKWQEKFQPVEDAANKLYSKMETAYGDALEKINKFESPTGEELPEYAE
ncbi:hypothetical protein GCM10027570_35320 [Streptomonospora sediminis]